VDISLGAGGEEKNHPTTLSKRNFIHLVITAHFLFTLFFCRLYGGEPIPVKNPFMEGHEKLAAPPLNSLRIDQCLICGLDHGHLRVIELGGAIHVVKLSKSWGGCQSFGERVGGRGI
jgi:hypothetical protein